MGTTTQPKALTPKQPDEVLDYDFDWTKRLSPSADTITDATVIVDDPGLTLLNTVVSPLIVKQFVGGGVDGHTYKLTCYITTAFMPRNRYLEAELYVKVKEL